MSATLNVMTSSTQDFSNEIDSDEYGLLILKDEINQPSENVRNSVNLYFSSDQWVLQSHYR